MLEQQTALENNATGFPRSQPNKRPRTVLNQTEVAHGNTFVVLNDDRANFNVCVVYLDRTRYNHRMMVVDGKGIVSTGGRCSTQAR